MGTNETFRKSWHERVSSSDGYSVRVIGRTGLDYRDDLGSFRIDSESMSGPDMEVVVYPRSIPELPGRSRAEVLDRLRRAFEYAGWKLTVDGS
jgi:hypothetical protein